MNYSWKGLVAGLLLSVTISVGAQEKVAVWDFKSCLSYARSQNIQIRKSRVASEEGSENVLQAKAERLPSLSFSTSHDYTNHPRPEGGDRNSYSGSYALRSSVSLYNGGQLKKNIQQMELHSQVRELAVEEAENEIEVAVMQAFVQILYIHETVQINANTVEVSKAQWERGKELLAAGSLSQADLAQLEAQYTSDQYQLVVARTSLSTAQLELKQLLELGINDRMELSMPEITEERVLTVLPVKESIYLTSLGVMPEVKYNRLNVEIAGIEKSRAWSGYLPSLNLSAGLGTAHSSGMGRGFGTQVRNNWNESVGLTLSVPIYSNRTNRTAVNLARLNIENAELDYENVRKGLLKSIETVYQDAISAQERFRSAQENLKATGLSFELTQQQFSLGMKNTVEMLTEKNHFLSAQQELVQAKYMAILNIQLLNFYQGKEMDL